MPNNVLTVSSSSKQQVSVLQSDYEVVQAQKPLLLAPSQQVGKTVGKSAVKFTQAVDTTEFVQQTVLLPSLESRLCNDILNKNKDAYKKAGWQPVVQFARDLEVEIQQMFEKPGLLNSLNAAGISELMNTLTKIGAGLTWLEGERRNWFKDMFAPFFTGYESEIKSFETSYARLNLAIRALYAMHEKQVAIELHQ